MKAMRRFRIPLIVTGMALALALVVGVVGATCLHLTEASSRKRTERAKQLGTGAAVATCLLIAPFWLIAAAKMGRARRRSRPRGN